MFKRRIALATLAAAAVAATTPIAQAQPALDKTVKVVVGFPAGGASDAVARLLDGLALRDRFDDAEVEDARRYLIGIAPLANETSADIVAQASALAAAGLEPEFMNHHFADLAADIAGTAAGYAAVEHFIAED